MSEKDSEGSIFDVVARRRQRSKRLNELAGSVGSAPKESEGEPDVEPFVVEASSGTEQMEIAPVTEPASVEPNASDAALRPEESTPLPPGESQASPEPSVEVDDEEEEEKREAQEKAVEQASLTDAASEVAEMEIDASIEEDPIAQAEKETAAMKETIDGLDPIIDFGALPASQPKRILAKTEKSSKSQGTQNAAKPKQSKRPSKRTEPSDEKAKAKRVSLLDNYFKDL